MRSPVLPWLLELQGQSSIGQLAQALVSDWWSGQVFDQDLEAFTVVATSAGVGVDVESGHVRAALPGDHILGVVAKGTQAKHATPAAGPGGDQSLH